MPPLIEMAEGNAPVAQMAGIHPLDEHAAAAPNDYAAAPPDNVAPHVPALPGFRLSPENQPQRHLHRQAVGLAGMIDAMCTCLACCLCWLDCVNFQAEGQAKNTLVKRIYWLQVVLTVCIIVISGILVVANDFYLKLVLGIASAVLAAFLKFTASFDKDITEYADRLRRIHDQVNQEAELFLEEANQVEGMPH